MEATLAPARSTAARMAGRSPPGSITTAVLLTGSTTTEQLQPSGPTGKVWMSIAAQLIPTLAPLSLTAPEASMLIGPDPLTATVPEAVTLTSPEEVTSSVWASTLTGPSMETLRFFPATETLPLLSMVILESPH